MRVDAPWLGTAGRSSMAEMSLFKLMCARCGEPALKRYRLDTREEYRQCACTHSDPLATCDVIEVATDCRECVKEARDHGPIPDELCASCGEPYMRGCKREHHHSAWLDCYDTSDVRSLPCGCIVHKECAKSGARCQYMPEWPLTENVDP